MKIFKTVFGNLHSRIWFITTAVLIAVLIAANIVGMGVIYGVLNNVFGGPRRVVSGMGDPTYTTEFKSKADVLAYANSVNEKICEEGIILLKNGGTDSLSDDVLPLIAPAGTKLKAGVFGKNSANLVYGGSGSGGANLGGKFGIYDSLTAAGFDYNADLKSFYEGSGSGSGRPGNPAIENDGLAGLATGETPVSSYSGNLINTFQNDDFALVVFSRIGGEGFDLPTTMRQSFTNANPVRGAASASDHYLELDQNEQEMLRMVCDNYEKVIVIVNSSQPMELGFLDSIDDNDVTQISYDFASQVQGALWIGSPGDTGIMALGRVLNGTVNPSGRTVDTYVRDFSADPVWNNFGTNGVADSDSYTAGGTRKGYYFIDYEESIYVGYRYYETRGASGIIGGEGETWYKNNVVFPFGYGLSYTAFDWEIVKSVPAAGSNLTASGNIAIDVKVTNAGSAAGKDVVQAYLTAPYKNGEIEKAHKVLTAFEKTKLIEPGQSDTVTLEFSVYSMASYDYKDANNNGFKGWELDAGNYMINIGKNAHDSVGSVNYNISSSIKYGEDPVTGVEVVNRYNDASEQLQTLLTRGNWSGTWPQRRTAQQKEASQQFIDAFSVYESGNPLTKDSDKVKKANLSYAKKKTNSDISLYMLAGAEYDDAIWDELLSRLTVSTMMELCNMAAYSTIGIDYIMKPITLDCDGPAGFANFMGSNDIYDTCIYASECVIAATWNQELAYTMGEAIGHEGLIGNERIDGTPYSGWYAPAINIHRSPFSGRNFEYYSEDSVLNGKLAAQVIKGASSKGIYTYVKHFVANDQETHRADSGLCTWLTEQSLREIYLKAFEIAIKEGHSKGVMSSFNRLGTKWTGGDYRLLTEILREEWGFVGAVICDFATAGYMNNKQMSYAGGDILLNNLKTYTAWVNTSNPVDVYILKQCTKNILFLIANSSAMNGFGDGSTYRTAMPYWQIGLIISDCVLLTGLCVWGFFAIRGAVKKDKTLNK